MRDPAPQGPTWGKRLTWVALGLVPFLIVAGLISLRSVDSDGDGFDDSAVPPTIEIVEPAHDSRFLVGEPIRAAFRLHGGRGMKPKCHGPQSEARRYDPVGGAGGPRP